MINAIWMLKDVLTELYDEIINSDYGAESYGLLVKLVSDHQHYHMLIYGNDNYKGVYIIDNNKEKVEIECICYHDSGWRTTIERFLFENSNSIHFDMFPNRIMYEVVKKLTRSIAVVNLTNKQKIVLINVRKKKYG